MKNIFPNHKPFLDNEAWAIPRDMLFYGALKDDITFREYMVLQFEQTKIKLGTDKKQIENLRRMLCGSRTTHWRARKGLIQKDYLAEQKNG